jgi:hypothetical protein
LAELLNSHHPTSNLIELIHLYFSLSFSLSLSPSLSLLYSPQPPPLPSLLPLKEGDTQDANMPNAKRINCLKSQSENPCLKFQIWIFMISNLLYTDISIEEIYFVTSGSFINNTFFSYHAQ